ELRILLRPSLVPFCRARSLLPSLLVDLGPLASELVQEATCFPSAITPRRPIDPYHCWTSHFPIFCRLRIPLRIQIAPAPRDYCAGLHFASAIAPVRSPRSLRDPFCEELGKSDSVPRVMGHSGLL